MARMTQAMRMICLPAWILAFLGFAIGKFTPDRLVVGLMFAYIILGTFVDLLKGDG